MTYNLNTSIAECLWKYMKQCKKRNIRCGCSESFLHCTSSNMREWRFSLALFLLFEDKFPFFFLDFLLRREKAVMWKTVFSHSVNSANFLLYFCYFKSRIFATSSLNFKVNTRKNLVDFRHPEKADWYSSSISMSFFL